MGRMFGTDGVRGVAGKELTIDLAMKLGQAGAYVLTKEKAHQPTIIVGCDTRISGGMLANALMAGICSVGANAVYMGVMPTPAIAYLTKKHKVDAGVVISASHNPMEFNGIKFFNGEGYKLSDQLEDEIEELIQSGMKDIKMPIGSGIGSVAYRMDAREEYVFFMKKTVPVDLSGLKIVIDCAEGAAYYTAVETLKGLGANLVAIHTNPDGTNINANCGSTHMDELRARVVYEKADVGLAFDGDADRMLAVDELGNEVDGDQIMALCADDMMRHGTLHGNVLVSTVMSNMALEVFMEERGGRLERTRVGDRYVGETMRRLDATLGGEQSGHLIFRNYSTTGDGLLAALQVLRIMRERGQPLSKLADQLQLFPQRLISVPVQRKPPLEECSEIQDAVRAAEVELAEPDKRGRVLLRYSGTENVCRVMVESSREDVVQRLAKELSDVVRRALG